MGRESRRKAQQGATTGEAPGRPPAGARAPVGAGALALVAGLCGLVAVLARVQVLDFAFVYDDVITLVEGTYIRRWANVFRIYGADAFATWGDMVDPARPLCNLTLFLDHSLWGLEPSGFHGTSLVLHGLAVAAAVWAAASVSRGLLAPLVVGLAMALHPVHTEAVACISYREDLLFSLLGFCTLALWWRSPSEAMSRRRQAALVALFTAALLSKEHALVVPVVAWLGEQLLPVLRDAGGRAPRGRRGLLVGCAIVAAAFLAFRATFEGGLEQEGRAPLPGGSVPWLVVRNLGLLAWPVPLSADWVVGGVGPGRWLAGLVVVLGLGALAWRQRRSRPRLAFGVAAFLVALAPVSNIVPLYRALAERYLYFPSWPVFLLVGWGVGELWQRPGLRRGVAPGVTLALGGLLLLAGWRSQATTAVWRDELSLWTATASVSPDSFRAWNHLGKAQAEAGRHDEAVVSYRRALAIRPDHVKVASNLGALHIQRGDAAAGEQAFRDLLGMVPEYPVAWYNLGVAVERQGRFEEAVEHFARAVGLSERYLVARTRLAATLAQLGHRERAEEQARILLEMEPGNEVARQILGQGGD